MELRQDRGAKQIPKASLPSERFQPIACMVDTRKNHKPIDGLTAVDINVAGNDIVEADQAIGKRSVEC